MIGGDSFQQLASCCNQSLMVGRLSIAQLAKITLQQLERTFSELVVRGLEGGNGLGISLGL